MSFPVQERDAPLRSRRKCRYVVRTDIDFYLALHKLPTYFHGIPGAKNEYSLDRKIAGRWMDGDVINIRGGSRLASVSRSERIGHRRHSRVAHGVWSQVERGLANNAASRGVVTYRDGAAHLPYGCRRKKTRNLVPRSIQRQDSVAKIRHSLPC